MKGTLVIAVRWIAALALVAAVQGAVLPTAVRSLPVELPGITEIGCGYDVNGRYASSLSIKLPLFDLYQNGTGAIEQSLHPWHPAYRMPKSVIFHRAFSTEHSFSSGSSSTELANSMSRRVGVKADYGTFSASVETEFARTTLSSTAFTYSRVQYNVNLYTLQLGTVSELQGMLTATARRDINNMDPDELFDHYGAYFLSSLVMGGRSVVAAATSKYSYNSSASLEHVAKASACAMIGYLGTSAFTDGNLEQDAKNFKASSKISITTKGGDPQYGSELPAKFQDWSNSVQTFPLFVDFLDKKSLQGIWKLADNPARKKQLKEAATKYLADKASTIPQADGPVLQGKWVSLVPVAKSDGSGAKKSLYVYKPRIGKDDSEWKYLSQTAFTNREVSAHTKGLVVRELVTGVLGKIGVWDRIYDNGGSGASKAFNMWQPVPASSINYDAMGSFFRGPVETQDPPTADEAAQLAVLHKEFTVPINKSNLIWSDCTDLQQHGSTSWNPLRWAVSAWNRLFGSKEAPAKKYGSIWKPKCNPAEYVAVSWGGLVGSEAPDYASVPPSRLRAIKKSAIVFYGKDQDITGGCPSRLIDENESEVSDLEHDDVLSMLAPGAKPSSFVRYSYNDKS